MGSNLTWVLRFGRTERLVHWVQAITFLVLLASGLVLGISQLETLVGHRAILREIHLTMAFFFVFGPALVVLAGDRRAVIENVHEVDEWDRDDLRWLLRPKLEPDAWTPPAGKFNAGQKLNVIFTMYATVAFAATGFILWQNRRFPFYLVSQANFIHTYLAYFALAVFLGHLYLAVAHPATRHALHGIVLGTVRRDWAEQHHPKWRYPRISEPPLHLSSVLRAVVLLLIGAEGVLLGVRAAFEWLGANPTDPVTRWLYRLSGLPATLTHHAAGFHRFDLAALVWAGLAVAVLLTLVRGQALLPRTLTMSANRRLAKEETVINHKRSFSHHRR
jgi:formate dehydrogenase subunit gamma